MVASSKKEAADFWPRSRSSVRWAQAAREERRRTLHSGAGWMAREVMLPDGILSGPAVTMAQGQMLSFPLQGIHAPAEPVNFDGLFNQCTQIGLARPNGPDGKPAVELVFYNFTREEFAKHNGVPNAAEKVGSLIVDAKPDQQYIDIRLEQQAESPARPRFVRIIPIKGNLQFQVAELFPIK